MKVKQTRPSKSKTLVRHILQLFLCLATGCCYLLSLLLAHADNNPDSLTTNSKSSTCKWTLILGDSNNRNAFVEWERLETKLANFTTQQQRRAVLKAPDGSHSKNGAVATADDQSCDERWYDREMVILNQEKDSETTCHVVSFKFLRDQDVSVQRLLRGNNLHSQQYCVGGTIITATQHHDVYFQQLQWKRPIQPHLIWFSTGFWELAQQKQDDCDQRFELVVQAIQQWRLQGIRVIWQSLFPINSHPEITNRHIDRDYRCQKQVASQQGIEMADVYKPIQSMGVRKVVNTYHLNDYMYERHFVQPLLDVCCGGWENYYYRVTGKGNVPDHPQTNGWSER